MRFMMLYKPGRDDGAPPKPEAFAKLNQVIAAQLESGILVATGGLAPSANGARVRLSENGSFKVTDGPFAETKEIVAGFAIMNFDTLEDAIRATKEFLTIMGGGETEVRPMHEVPPGDANVQKHASAGAAAR